ncbi:MAG: alkylhydroperoxidase, partial [Bacteroidia bacterium]|nr:alkylhydroperoxidase [Bacteroidia bacterium]
DVRATDLKNGIKNNTYDDLFDNHYGNGLEYAKLLTVDLKNVSKSHIDRLKDSGFSDGEILEINQVTSYFNYVNRTVVGLGVSAKDEVLGLSPNDSDDPDNWSHQ